MSDEVAHLIQDELTKYRNELERIEAAIAEKPEVKKQIEKYEKMLDIYAGNNTKKPQQVKKPKAKTRRGRRKGEPTLLKVVTDYFDSHPNDEVSAGDIANATGRLAPSVNTVVKTLEQQGAIRFVRQGGKTGATKYYRRVASWELGGEIARTN